MTTRAGAARCRTMIRHSGCVLGRIVKEVVVKRHSRAIAMTSLAAAVLLLPATGFSQGRRSGRVLRPAVVVAPYYYRPYFYDPFYFGWYYPYYQPPYRYGAAFERDAALRLQVTPR